MSGVRGEYVVLARRHRPLRFEQVIGQEHVTRTLRNAIERDRVHHAYLFSGSRGVGKTTVARILARALNCEAQDGPTAEPCGECEGCNATVDVFEIDGASHTGVDDIRELRENVRYLPARLRKKIYIIDEVHMLSTSAFNALLKTLEEPPPHVVFMFATTEPHKIPATILSRCQRFDFKRVPLSVVTDHLATLAEQEGVDVARDGLAIIARAGEGSVRDALSLLDQVIAYGPAEGEETLSAARVAEVLGVADRRVLFSLSRAVLEGDAQGALRIIDELFAQGFDLSQLSKRLLSHLRDLVVVRAVGDARALVDATETELGELTEQARDERGVLWRQHFDTFARAAEEIARSSYPRLLLEMAVIEMVHAEPMLPLGDLLERLEGLEGRLGGGAAASAPAPARRG
ncbi:MAG: DNA polymerase III subunit gamma/tau, partial [Myxococcales bacterium]|nr:DNA polymerase III subunit gamma/tau [Myxococcales bacterium]